MAKENTKFSKSEHDTWPKLTSSRAEKIETSTQDDWRERSEKQVHRGRVERTVEVEESSLLVDTPGATPLVVPNTMVEAGDSRSKTWRTKVKVASGGSGGSGGSVRVRDSNGIWGIVNGGGSGGGRDHSGGRALSFEAMEEENEILQEEEDWAPDLDRRRAIKRRCLGRRAWELLGRTF